MSPCIRIKSFYAAVVTAFLFRTSFLRIVGEYNVYGVLSCVPTNSDRQGDLGRYTHTREMPLLLPRPLLLAVSVVDK